MEAANGGRECKICGRQFANGKAMGGHMRSHLAKLPLPAPKQPQQPEPSHSPPTIRSANSELSFVAVSDQTVHDDRQSDTDDKASFGQPKPRSKKRSRRSDVSSSVSSGVAAAYSMTAEDAAMCLLLLSEDNNDDDDDEEEDDEEEMMMMSSEDDDETESEDEESEEEESFCNMKRKRRQRTTSSRANHHRIHGLGETSQRIFKCPFCDKVFGSGQGLGGHKKVHFLNNSNAASANKKINNNRKKSDDVDCDNNNNNTADQKGMHGRLVIDLNLPAEAPEDYNQEVPEVVNRRT